MLDLSSALAGGLHQPPATTSLPTRITFSEPEPVFGRVAGMGRCVVGVRLSGTFPTVPSAISLRHIDQAREALRRAGHDAGHAAIQVEFVYPDRWAGPRRRSTPRGLAITATIPCQPFAVPKMARAA